MPNSSCWIVDIAYLPRMVLETTVTLTSDINLESSNDLELRLELSPSGEILHAEVLDEVKNGEGKVVGKNSQGITVWLAWKLLGGKSDLARKMLVEAYHMQEEKP
jgi:hypothetical protein